MNFAPKLPGWGLRNRPVWVGGLSPCFIIGRMRSIRANQASRVTASPRSSLRNHRRWPEFTRNDNSVLCCGDRADERPECPCHRQYDQEGLSTDRKSTRLNSSHLG